MRCPLTQAWPFPMLPRPMATGSLPSGASNIVCIHETVVMTWNKRRRLNFLEVYSWHEGSNRLIVNPNFPDWKCQSCLENNFYHRTIQSMIHQISTSCGSKIIKKTYFEPCEGCLCVIILHATPLSTSLVLRRIDLRKLTFQTNLQFGKKSFSKLSSVI